ncbi:MAG: hypothetical protein ABI477_03645 [Chryseolinea sp.]
MNWVTGALAFIFFHTSGYGQTDSPQSLKLTIKEETLALDSSSTILRLTLTFRNESDHDLLIYGLTGDMQAAPLALSDLCRPDVGTGMAIALYHKDGTQEMPMVNMAAFTKTKSRKMPDSVRQAGESLFISSSMVIAKGEDRSFAKEVPINDFYLEKGSYDLEVIYYCGKKISAVVDVRKVNPGKALLFQGCALSRRISLIIR